MITLHNRKQHVVQKAHQLFIEKGFQATSIQDILDYSGISKGTFYNYFASKNELLITLFKEIYEKLEKDRNELLIGQNPADIEVFIKQIELQLNTNQKNKLVALFEEVFVLNDEDLKGFIKRSQLRTLRWIYERFLEIFGEDKKPYLLDCAITFLGILNHNIKYYRIGHDINDGIYEVVRYSVNRIVKMVYEVAQSEEQLNGPELLETLVPVSRSIGKTTQQHMEETIDYLKKMLSNSDEDLVYVELIDFVKHEILHSNSPRNMLIQSALNTLKINTRYVKEIEELEKMLTDF
ncbi:TetR/AcrR family transcriptional regulator [Bacillaceae bacterium S4-13-58]